MLAIDQGTSGTKAIVVSGDSILAAAEVPIRPRYGGDGAVEQDPGELLASVRTAGLKAMSDARVPIDAVALANQGESVLAWDPASGAAISPIVVWQDGRAEDVCRDLAAHADMIAERTGLMLDPYFTAPKQAWIRRHVTGDGVVTTTDTWLLHQLTGSFITDAATASRSLVFDLEAGTWDDELLGIFGLGSEPIPQLMPCDCVVGATRAFGAEVPVAGIIVDQQAALLAEGCLEPGEAKCTFGTGAFLLANIGAAPRRSRAGLATSVAWLARGQTSYCLDGQVYTAASAVRWLQQLGFIRQASDLDAVAAPDAEGVIVVPALAGLAAPWWRPDARASFHGMTLSTEPAHLVRATLEGIAAQVAQICDVVAHDLGQPLQRLRVDGGLTRSEILMQAVADLAQVTVEVYPSPNATALGAAALARLALDPALGLADAVLPWSVERSYEPRWNADRAGDFRMRWTAAAGSS